MKEKGKRKEQAEAPKRSDENKTPKRKSSQRYRWINFYHEENSKAFKEAKEFRTSHQLLVHGLPKTLLSPTRAGPQERALNDLMAGLIQETLGEDGINLVQENIIGAYPIEPTPSDRSPVTRITLDSRETKASIRKAAEKADRWGNGTHSVFFGDITLEKRRRKSSNEDTNTPKRGKLEDTPKRGGERKMSRLAQIGAQIRRESRREERPRTVWQRQKEQDDLERQRIQIKEDQLKARTAKREHQLREEKEAQEKASGQQNAGPSQEKISPVKPFRAVNEVNLQESEPPRTPDPGDPEGSAKSDEYETEESTEVFLKGESDEEIELPDSESEFENLRSEYEEHELEPEYQPSEEEELYVPSPSPEREVTFTPLRSTSKNARRNFRRRIAKKKLRNQDQYNADKKRMEINERLWSKRGKSKLQSSTLRPQRAPTLSTEILSDSDARADPRHSKQSKSRRESQESVEELDSQGRKVPTNKHRNRRH